jgi:hypothetical protein
MDWIRIIVGMSGAIVAAIVINSRTQRKRKQSPLSIEELRQENSALNFTFVFTGFSLLLAAPWLNWSFLGVPWTGLFYLVCMASVYQAAKWISKWFGRPAPTVQQQTGNS